MPKRAAFLAGLAIFLTGAIPLAGRLAAHGEGHAPVLDLAPPVAGALSLFDVPVELTPKDARAGGLAVCVRLCDGFFFPSAKSSDGDEACAAQCPDSPTVRYTERAGSDGIEDAVSMRGAPYTALATANRYRTTLDNTCSCHRSVARGYSYSVLNDPTLRKGDVVVTPKGFLVFQGAKTRSIVASDFVALAQARSLSEERRAALIDMEGRGSSQRIGGLSSSADGPAPQSGALTPVASAAATK